MGTAGRPPADKRPAFVRCKRIKRDGTQCRKSAVPGFNCCDTPSHGGNLPQVQKAIARQRVVAGLSKLVTPIDADDWEANPINSFEMEFRRTVARIRYYDEKLMQLETEKDLIFGVTKTEHKNEYAAVLEDKSYRLETQEARINGFLDLQMKERIHLTDLHKLWISAKLDDRRLAIQEKTVFMLNDAITSIVRGLGKDIHDPDVRQLVRTALLDLPGVDALAGAS